MQFCLEQLPNKSRKLIDGYYFNQQSANSIAKKADISAGSVRMKLLRIRQILQKCIVARSQDASGSQSVVGLDNAVRRSRTGRAIKSAGQDVRFR